MKLMTMDGAELMEVSEIRAEASTLIIEGTIMGAMPTRAVLTPTELRSALKLLKLRTIVSIIGMLFRK
jgi:hypothetical protein